MASGSRSRAAFICRKGPATSARPTRTRALRSGRPLGAHGKTTHFNAAPIASHRLTSIAGDLLFNLRRAGAAAASGSALVTIGKCRRLALNLLAKRKAIKKTHPVRCVLDLSHDPHEISLDENVMNRKSPTTPRRSLGQTRPRLLRGCRAPHGVACSPAEAGTAHPVPRHSDRATPPPVGPLSCPPARSSSGSIELSARTLEQDRRGRGQSGPDRPSGGGTQVNTEHGFSA